MAEAEKKSNQGLSPSREEILKVIYSELEKVNSENIQLKEATDITIDMNVDSVAIMDLVFEIEENFDISVPLNDLADVQTIGQLSDLVCSIARNTN